MGLVMLLPFIAWVITGIFFFFKPGYKEAYQLLPIKTYPLSQLIQLPDSQDWLEVRQLNTILGHHVLVRNEQGWQPLTTTDFKTIKQPTAEEVRTLVSDSITNNSSRYGDIADINDLKVTTDTGVEINLNWQQMTLRQYGKDTDFINKLYDIHYLRWTGNTAIDQYLGVIGLMLVLLLAVVGTVMTFSKTRVTNTIKCSCGRTSS